MTNPKQFETQQSNVNTSMNDSMQSMPKQSILIASKPGTAYMNNQAAAAQIYDGVYNQQIMMNGNGQNPFEILGGRQQKQKASSPNRYASEGRTTAATGTRRQSNGMTYMNAKKTMTNGFKLNGGPGGGHGPNPSATMHGSKRWNGFYPKFSN